MLSKKVTIFEGPDGSGKSTAAMEFAERTRARYVHLGPFPRVGDGLARMYVDAMMPAVLGYQDVVLDRCWLSEPIYGAVYREGQDRVGRANARMLTRLALRCGAVLVWCLPPEAEVLKTHAKRAQPEKLDGKIVNDLQLHEIYQLYQLAEVRDASGLPLLCHDYTRSPSIVTAQVDALRSSAHPLDIATAGVWNAPVVLVGQDFAPHKDPDPLYQWPFASLSPAGCSRWLTEELADHGIGEHQLLWVNADQDLRMLMLRPGTALVAMGEQADQAVKQLSAELPPRMVSELKLYTVPHPQAWRRFHKKQLYPLIQLLERLLW